MFNKLLNKLTESLTLEELESYYKLSLSDKNWFKFKK